MEFMNKDDTLSGLMSLAHTTENEHDKQVLKSAINAIVTSVAVLEWYERVEKQAINHGDTINLLVFSEIVKTALKMVRTGKND